MKTLPAAWELAITNPKSYQNTSSVQGSQIHQLHKNTLKPSAQVNGSDSIVFMIANRTPIQGERPGGEMLSSL